MSRGLGDVYKRQGERLKALKESLLSLGMIVIILGGIYGGICTATEAAAIACVYAVVIEVFVYRSISIKELFRVSVKSAQTISMLMILIAAGSVLSWTMTVMQLPVLLTNLLSGASWLTVFLLINMIFLIAGMFIDPNSANYRAGSADLSDGSGRGDQFRTAWNGHGYQSGHRYAVAAVWPEYFRGDFCL